MEFSELLPGDVILTIQEGQCKHAMIFVGAQEDSPLLTIAHGMFDSEKTSHNIVGLSRLPQGEYRVLRNKDVELAKKAAEQALKWAKKEIPYDRPRFLANTTRRLAEQKAAKMSDVDSPPTASTIMEHRAATTFVNDANRDSWKAGAHLPSGQLAAITAVDKDSRKQPSPASMEGMTRVIKYAARRDTFPTFPSPEDHDKIVKGREASHGFDCVFFASLCYQVAAVSDLVKPLAEGEWNSTKHTTTKTGQSTFPTLSSWNTSHGPMEKFDFAAVMPKSLMYDPKKMDINTFAAILFKSKDEWDNHGALTNIPNLTDENKESYKAARSSITANAKYEAAELHAAIEDKTKGTEVSDDTGQSHHLRR